MSVLETSSEFVFTLFFPYRRAECAAATHITLKRGRTCITIYVKADVISVRLNPLLLASAVHISPRPQGYKGSTPCLQIVGRKLDWESLTFFLNRCSNFRPYPRALLRRYRSLRTLFLNFHRHYDKRLSR